MQNTGPAGCLERFVVARVFFKKAGRVNMQKLFSGKRTHFAVVLITLRLALRVTVKRAKRKKVACHQNEPICCGRRVAVSNLWFVYNRPTGAFDMRHKKTAGRRSCNLMVVGGGFEPPKATPTDLQSVPFGHSGTPPHAGLCKSIGHTTDKQGPNKRVGSEKSTPKFNSGKHYN